MHIGIMFRGDGCFVLLSVCFLLYFDSSVNSAKLNKVEESKNRLLQNGIEDEEKGHYRPKSVHEKRINNLIEASEKSLRSSSPIKDKDKRRPSRRQNLQPAGKKKKWGKSKNKTRDENWKNNKNFKMRLSGIREKMKKDKLRRYDIAPATGCSSKFSVSSNACFGSKKRYKRSSSSAAYDQVQQWVNQTCTTCWNNLPWHILDVQLPALPTIPLPTLPFPTIQLPSLGSLSWPFSWPGSWFSR